MIDQRADDISGIGGRVGHDVDDAFGEARIAERVAACAIQTSRSCLISSNIAAPEASSTAMTEQEQVEPLLDATGGIAASRKLSKAA